MNARILLPLAVLIGIISVAGATSMKGNFYNPGFKSLYLQGNVTSNWGFQYQNMTYNASFRGNTSFNKTVILKQIATVASCRTAYFNSAVPIANNALKINLSTSQVDSANSRLQANISSNASVQVIRDNIKSFNSAQSMLYWQATGAARSLNQTQLKGLGTQLNGSLTTLKNCVSTSNSTGGFRLPGFGGGFLRWFGGLGMRFRLGGWFHFR
jgi:hypothetical protein